MSSFAIALRVSNQFGVLTRVSGMFSRRGFNIDSLTVSNTEDPSVSRMTLVGQGDEAVKKQIIKQLSKIHDVLEIQEMTPDICVSRELLLIKVAINGNTRQEIMDAASVFRGKIIDYSPHSFCIEMTGETSKVDAYVELMKPFGIMEMCRTGIVALERGESCLKNYAYHTGEEIA